MFPANTNSFSSYCSFGLFSGNSDVLSLTQLAFPGCSLTDRLEIGRAASCFLTADKILRVKGYWGRHVGDAFGHGFSRAIHIDFQTAAY